MNQSVKAEFQAACSATDSVRLPNSSIKQCIDRAISHHELTNNITYNNHIIELVNQITNQLLYNIVETANTLAQPNIQSIDHHTTEHDIVPYTIQQKHLNQSLHQLGLIDLLQLLSAIESNQLTGSDSNTMEHNKKLIRAKLNKKKHDIKHSSNEQQQLLIEKQQKLFQQSRMKLIMNNNHDT